MKPVYITATGSFLPGEPVDNDRIEEVLGMVGGKPSRLKKRILASNGIKTRHYALGPDGATTMLNEELAARAVLDALSRRGVDPSSVDMLAVGTTQGDLPVPGFASMVHGRLAREAPSTGPMELLSAGGVCCSGMAAMRAAALAVRAGERRCAVAAGSEMVSRMLKASRFEAESEGDEEPSFRDFDADFLRWMLSDGAGAVVLEPKPAATGLSLRVDWIELVSHAHEHPVCMHVGAKNKDAPGPGDTWLDYPSIARADRAGLMKVRQDTRILPEIVKLGVEEYLRLLRSERLQPPDHVLCHYSSAFFKGEIVKLLQQAGVMVPEERWFSNLATKGNTGAASIFVMLDEAMRAGRFREGERVVLMVPESGRFTVAFAHLTVVGPGDAGAVEASTPPREKRWAASGLAARPAQARDDDAVQAALAGSPLGASFADEGDEVQRFLAVELALVWADFERMLRAVPVVRRLDEGRATIEDYKRLLCNLRQQVMEGARWIARAASNVSIDKFELRSMFILHAGDEHKDYQMIERDFVAVGGSLDEIRSTPKNVGSEALSAFVFHQASQPDPLDLLGAMFVVEGLGTKKAGEWAQQLRRQLGLSPQQTSFLTYHGKNDEDHFGKLKDVVRSGFIDMGTARRVVKTAKVAARLYALQLEELDHV